MMPRSITVLIVDPDGAAEIRQVPAVLETFQQIVGGYIESIGSERFSAFINEEGKLAGLDPNRTADFIAKRWGWEGIPGDYLVGTVLFFGGADEDGDEISLSDELIIDAKSCLA